MFKLHPQVEITGPKVLGTIDLSAINSTTRPKKKSKEERRRERNNKQGAAGQNGRHRPADSAKSVTALAANVSM